MKPIGDKNKNEANEEKCEISFDNALLFEDPNLICVKAVRDGDDVSELFIANDAVVMQPNKTQTQKISGNIPCWIIDAMEAEANHLAISRSGVMNMWLARAANESLEGKMTS